MATFADLAEHTGTLVSLIGFLVILCSAFIGVIWRIMTKIAFTLKEDLFKMITQLEGRVGEVWDAIDEIRSKQEVLRETLPKEYIRMDGPGYKAIIEGINRIERQFEKFTEDCREGKCRRGGA